jgi:hypothetical protein
VLQATPYPTLAPTPALHLLVPSPLPTLQPTVGLKVDYIRPKRPKRAPTPVGQQAAALTPRPTAALGQSVANALGCLESAPEPFADGGAYIQFCLSQPAWVRVQVYGSKGKALWKSPEQAFDAGRHQVYFDGMVHAVALTPGAYVYEVQARYADGGRENRQGSLTKARRRQD